MNMRKTFRNWLTENTKLKEGTIVKYVNAIKQFEIEPTIIKQYGDIYNIRSIDSLIDIETLYLKNKENYRKNSDGNNMYTVAFHHYIDYIKFINEEDVVENILDNLNDDKLDVIKIFDESSKKIYTHIRNERDQGIIKKAKLRMLKKHGYLFCEKCGFNEMNNEKYGNEIIEGHHMLPVSKLNKNNVKNNTIDNIILLCPMCHKKLHIFMKINNRHELSKTEIEEISI